MSDNTGGSAFPFSDGASDIPVITLRDYFAAQVMNGLLCQNNNVSAPLSLDRKSTRLNSSHVSESRMPSSA